MINPTHFIEVYKGTYTNTIHQSKVLDIDLLNKLLCSKIYPKRDLISINNN